MSTAILTVAIGSTPTQVVVNGQEYLEAPAIASTPEPLPVILRARATTNAGPASRFQNKKQDDYVLITGALSLGPKDSDHDGYPIITMTSICDANKDQFINEAMFVGRFSKDGKPAEKSASRSIAVNRYVAGNQITDWYRVRGYGNWKERILCYPKGSLAEVLGMLTPAKDGKGKLYTEVKCRRIRLHEKTKGGGGAANPAKDTTASGYEHSDFMGSDEETGDMPTSNNWN